jgi:hypothetical protein
LQEFENITEKTKVAIWWHHFSIPPQVLNFFHRGENALFSNVCISTDHTTLCPNLGVMPSYSDAKTVFFRKLKQPSKFQKEKSKLKYQTNQSKRGRKDAVQEFVKFWPENYTAE